MWGLLPTTWDAYPSHPRSRRRRTRSCLRHPRRHRRKPSKGSRRQRGLPSQGATEIPGKTADLGAQNMRHQGRWNLVLWCFEKCADQGWLKARLCSIWFLWQEYIGIYLVGGLEHEFYFSHHIGKVIIPTDELTPSFFRGVGLKPPTRYHRNLSLPVDHSRSHPLIQPGGSSLDFEERSTKLDWAQFNAPSTPFSTRNGYSMVQSPFIDYG